MFKRPQKKNLRQRLDDEADHDEPMEVDSVDVAAIKKEKKKKKDKSSSDKPAKTKNALLSFDDDFNEDEGEVFQVKKSSQSKKLMRQMDKERRKRKEQEKMSSNGNHSSTVTIKQEPVDEAPIIKQIPLKRETPLILSGREAEYAVQRPDSEDEDEIFPKFSRPKQLHRVLESGCIPDAAMIHAARKSRQKAREMGDFIPVDDGKSNDSGNSRLVREDEEDHDVSDDEHGEIARGETKRIDFTVDTSARDQERRREAFLAAQEQEPASEHSDLDDDEVENWEAQQIRKAVTGAQLASAQQELIQQQGYLNHNQPQLVPQPVPAIVHKPTLSLTDGPATEQVLSQMLAKAEAHTPDELCRLLRDRLSSMKETQRRHALDRDNLLIELDDMTKDTEKITIDGPERSNRFQFYQNLRGYVTDLVECFDEKIPSLEQLEKRFVNLLAKKTNFMVQRRRQDVKDQSVEAAAKTKPVGMPAPIIEHDENRVRRAAEREGRRSRRRRAREVNMPSADMIQSLNLMPHYEGISSDDEQYELDISELKKQKEQILSDGEEVFDDVVDEFRDLDLIMKHFEEWKRFDLDSYKEAYVNLSLPKIVGPLVRLSIITWNPFEDSDIEFKKMYWFQKLLTYSVKSKTETLLNLKDDPDFNLISLVIEMAVLPRFGKIIVEAWDPCSSTQTQRLTSILRKILSEYPMLASRGRVTKSLLPAVVDKLKEAIDNDVFIPIYPVKSAPVVRQFFQRQFWSAFKLLKNTLAWKEFIGDAKLQEICLGALLGRYLLAALRTCEPMDALEKSRYLLAALPESWLNREPQFVQLQMFSTQVTNIIKAIEEKAPGNREAKLEALAILKSLGGKST